MSKKVIKLAAVMAASGLSRSSIYAYIPQGKFPRPIRTGERSVAWLEDEIDSWLQQRADMREGI